jgi:stage V sporulation protein AD
LTFSPAAADTIYSFLSDTNTTPSDYDLILTGDLGALGKELLIELLNRRGIAVSNVYNDCGCMIFYPGQTAPMGASGCGCAATVFNGCIVKEILSGKVKNVLLAATGAMLSPLSSFQGESIPGISYAVNFKGGCV